MSLFPSVVKRPKLVCGPLVPSKLSDAIAIDEYTPADAPEVISLMNRSLGRTQQVRRDVDYWHWKHEQNPFGRSIVLLARSDGQLVGLRAFMQWQLQIQGQMVRVGKPVDTVTHPEFQRRGIFRQLTNRACEVAKQRGIFLLFNTPNQNSRPGYLKLGWKPIGNVRFRFRPLHPWRMGWRLLTNKGSGSSPSVWTALRAVPAATLLQDHALVKDLLVETVDYDRAVTVKSYEWLRWRYSEHPHLSYFAMDVRRQGVLEGIVFFRANRRHGMHEIMVVDCLTRGDNVKVTQELFRKMRRLPEADYLVGCWNPATPTGRCWQRATLPAPPQKSAALIGRLQGPVEADWDPFELTQWNLSLGDLEGL